MEDPAPIVAAESAVSYAGFWRRFVGWLIDSLILVVLWHWASLPFDAVGQSQALAWMAGGFSVRMLFSPQYLMLSLGWLLTLFVIMALYYCLLEASPLRATLGKYIAGIQVTDMEGGRITYAKAFWRRVFSILSAIILFIGFIMAAFSAKKQALHDKLAKTVVVIKHKRSGLVLVGIIIATLLLGIASDHYLGAGFHISFTSPTATYDDQNGLQNYTVKTGDQVDPTLKQAVIDGFTTGRAIYQTKDPTAIRQYILGALATSSPDYSQYASMSDADLLNMAALFNEVASGTTYDELNASDTTWTFNTQMTAVKVSFLAPIAGTTGTISLDLVYYDGKWAF